MRSKLYGGTYTADRDQRLIVDGILSHLRPRMALTAATKAGSSSMVEVTGEEPPLMS